MREEQGSLPNTILNHYAMHNAPAPALEVVAFWRDAGPDKWFAKDMQFDETFRNRFALLHLAAASRVHDNWQEYPYASLALILLLDQFPRNAFRGTAHMFATDPLARRYARAFLNGGFLEHVEQPLRQFACIPFMHSENLADQAFAMELYRTHEPESMSWAIEHYDIIQRFGRFPHRNYLLGRDTTPEEQQFLDNGGFAG